MLFQKSRDLEKNSTKFKATSVMWEQDQGSKEVLPVPVKKVSRKKSVSEEGAEILL